MDRLNKDLIGVIFEKITPTDWYCASLVCKRWWANISKWLSIRKKAFIKHLKYHVNLFALDVKTSKDKFCIFPMYYLREAGYGCKGVIKNNMCSRHKILSVYNKEICEMCKKNPSSSNCFGNRCNSLTCRDYIYVLKNGKAERVESHHCKYPDCDRFSDAKGGLCFGHAVSLASKEENETEIKSYRCVSVTQSKNRCTLKTSSRIAKCHHHAFSPISLAE